MRSYPTVAVSVGVVIAATFGWFAPRVVLLGWLTVAASIAAGALGAAMLLCMLRLGRSRLLQAWDTPLLSAVPWLFAAPVLCLPLVVGADTLYGWNADTAFADQRWYLNVPFFIVRALLYLAAFVGIAVALPAAARASRLAALLIVAFVVANMVGVDAIMALTPTWHSSDFGLRWSVDGLMIAASLAVAWQSLYRRGASVDDTRSRIDGATLLFALDLGWLYLMFVDYVTAWSGNLPDEAIWYGPRTQGMWAAVFAAFVALHVLAGALLLSRRIKRSASILFPLAVLMLVAQWLESDWTIIPETGVNAVVATATSLFSLAAIVCTSLAWRTASGRTTRRMAHG